MSDDVPKLKNQPLTAGRFPTKGRQPAVESNVPATLNAVLRQTPEMFGGISTD